MRRVRRLLSRWSQATTEGTDVNDTAVLVVALILAVLIVAAFSKPARQMVGGIFERDNKGRLILILTPVPKKKRKPPRRKQ